MKKSYGRRSAAMRYYTQPVRSTQYRTCPDCRAALDSGERCDCNKEADAAILAEVCKKKGAEDNDKRK